MVHLLMHIISEANCEDKSWRGRIIHRGELVTSVAHLKRDTGITTQSIRTCLERLKSTNEITTSTTNRFTLITVIEYEKYQENQKKNKPNNKPTNKQLTNNQQQLKNIEEDRRNVCVEKLTPPPQQKKTIALIGPIFGLRDFTDKNLPELVAEFDRQARADEAKEPHSVKRRLLSVKKKWEKSGFVTTKFNHILEDYKTIL